MIRGDRVYLRAVEVTDLDNCVRWVNDEEVTKYILAGLWPISRLAEQAWLERAARGENPNDRVLSVCTVADDRHIGVCGLHRINWPARRAELSMLIGEKELWDQGYGTDAVGALLRLAFDRLNLRKVRLGVFGFNTRAIRCYEKCGFVQEGLLREQDYKDGRYVDEVVMSVWAPGCTPRDRQPAGDR